MQNTDILIVGGGIVGLATAYHLTREFPTRKVTILEKEPALASHQTGRNSGVLHSGIYYRPGSLRAMNCRAGKLAMEQFCAAEGIAYEICGKVIVATSESEFPATERIYQRGQANGVKCQMIDRAHLIELEPHTAGLRRSTFRRPALSTIPQFAAAWLSGSKRPADRLFAARGCGRCITSPRE